MNLGIRDQALLIGFDPTGKCVYIKAMPVADYWDGDHVWDDPEQTKNLKLQKIVGFLFGQSGNLLQQFESTFNIHTGVFEEGWTKHEDGTLHKL